MPTLNQRTLKSTYTKKSLCVDTKNFLAFTQKLGQTHKRTQKIHASMCTHKYSF